MILVVYFFLGSGRAALIPSVAVPLSLLGTFAVMYLCGYSLNNLSLMALTIATGFVVDDAVVVLENTARHIEAGVEPMAAALRGAQEVGFTVMSMSISLIAVFIAYFINGRFGRSFISRICSDFIQRHSNFIIGFFDSDADDVRAVAQTVFAKKKPISYWQNFLLQVRQRYANSLNFAIDHSRLMLCNSIGGNSL